MVETTLEKHNPYGILVDNFTDSETLLINTLNLKVRKDIINKITYSFNSQEVSKSSGVWYEWKEFFNHIVLFEFKESSGWPFQ